MLCASEFWVIAALLGWAALVGSWMLARFETKRKPRLDTTVSSKRRVYTSGGEGGGSWSYLVLFRDSAGQTHEVVVWKRTWEKMSAGDSLVVYKKEGRKVGYAHLSLPIRAASRPTQILLGLSGIFSLFLPVTAAMSLTGTPFPGCG